MTNHSLDTLLNDLPDPLRPVVAKQWESYQDKAGDSALAADAETLRVWSLSDFVAQSCVRNPAMFAELKRSGDLERPYRDGEMASRLTALLAECPDEPQLMERLRTFRNREMVRLYWRDLAGHADLAEVVETMSALADAAVDVTLKTLYAWHSEQWGTPRYENGEAMQMLVLGMGKLGARELNVSSDIDLIFAFSHEGQTEGGRRQTSHQEFFVRLGQRLINALNQTNAYGFVFRVDMRLRPFGDASALAHSFDAMETYYQVHGREWERYAMIKARVISGTDDDANELMSMLRPFVYRRYIDFGAFESLREMKGMIEREIKRKGMAGNVKLGAGGIREIEFVGQAFQLIRGGQEKTLQERPILKVLQTLQRLDMLPAFVVTELTNAYIFLRNVEHRIQAMEDKQTHLLPTDDVGQTRIATGMGFADWDSFEAVLQRHMQRVHQHFDQTFAAPQRDHAESDQLDLTGIWLGKLDDEHAIQTLQQAGYGTPETAVDRLGRIRNASSYRSLSATGKSRMDKLMPLVLGAASNTDNPSVTLERLLDLIESVTRRTAYLALLVENPVALSQLVRLCSASVWISRLLARHPHLLDELLDPRSLYYPPSREQMVEELRGRLAQVDIDDLEGQMNALRHFKQANVLRVAAADVMESMPLMVVSDHLTYIAEIILDEVLELAWRHMVSRHGRPQCGDHLACDKGFAIIAYGKMGGIELSYSSDLDIIFVHNADASGRATDGDKPLDNPVFYARLAQRIVHLLATKTAAGDLYEVDLRLRPSGNSGLLVSSSEALATYQREQAWTWEHQALVRARYIVGDPKVAEAFADIRTEQLTRERDPEALRTEVREMREKMRANLDKSDSEKFDLKQGAGGIADIEFMVQYGVLAWARSHPDLLEFTDNIRLLEGFARNGLMSESDVTLLIEAFRYYRTAAHHLALQESSGVVERQQVEQDREKVAAIWSAMMEAG